MLSKRLLRTGAALCALALFSQPALADRKANERIQSLEQRVDQLDRVMEGQALMEMSQRIDELQREVRELRGQNEQLNHDLDTLKGRQRELYLDVDRRMQEIEAGAAGTSAALISDDAGADPAAIPAAGQGAQSATPPGSTAAPASAAEREAYKAAFALLKTGRYASAIESFRKFLSDYPKSSYAGNAQYWLGEANYVSKDYKTAVVEFNKVLKDFPASNKVSDARLKLGFTHYELEQWKQAQTILSGVEKDYPDTTVARLAGQRLARMKREGH